MALLWFDGFASYDAIADILTPKNTNISTIDQAGIFLGPYGRIAPKGLMFLDHGDYMTWVLSANHVELVMGMAIYRNTAGAPTYNSGVPFIEIFDSATSHLKFHLVGTEIAVYRGDNVLLGTSSGAGIAYQEWRYIEVKFTIGNAPDGAVIVRSGKTAVLTLSAIDTQNAGNAYMNKFIIRGIFSSINIYFTDWYFLDTTGSAPCNDFLGDVKVDSLRPDAAGTYTDFTPSTGANYQNVDEALGPDDDTTYNESGTVGHQDSYGLPTLPAPSGTTIYGVKDQITVRKTDAGVMESKILSVQGGSDYLGDAIALGETYTTHTRIMEVNPDDSAAWEDADISGGEIGVEITT